MIRTSLIAAVILIVCGVGAYWYAQGKDGNTAFSQTNPPADASAGSTIKAPEKAAGTEYWTKRCNPEGDKYCEVFQRLSLKDSQQRLIEFAVGYPIRSICVGHNI